MPIGIDDGIGEMKHQQQQQQEYKKSGRDAVIALMFHDDVD